MYLANLLTRAAQSHGGTTSLVHAGRSFTWRETEARVRRLAGALTELAGAGLAGAPGRAVVVLGLSGIEYFELTFATPMAGLVFVPMNVRMTVAELRTLLAQLDIGVVAFGPEFAATVARLDLACPALPWGEADSPFERAVAAAAPVDHVPVDPAADWAIVFTGGTTGLPKGVRLSHGAMAYNVANILKDLPWEEGCRFLQVTPLFHLAGLGPSFACTGLGGTHFFLPDFSIPGLLGALAEQRCTCTNLVPTMIAWMLAHEELDRYDLSALRSLGYGASAIPLPILEALLRRLPSLRFSQFYGQTESAGGLTTLLAVDHDLDPTVRHRLASAGRPVSGAHVVILDERGREQPPGAWGEICGRSPGLFSGYLGHPELTAETMRGGWLHTGDIGYMDDDGFVYVTDRLKDMIVTGGENVSSSEVEAAILRYPGVLQAAVVAAPDAMWGERVHAFVIGDPDRLDEEALKSHCRELIAGYKVPKTLTIRREPLPLSEIGKIRKDVLRAQVRTD